MVATEDVMRLMVGVTLLIIGLLIFSRVFSQPECDDMAMKSAQQCAAAISQAATMPISNGEPDTDAKDMYTLCPIRFCQPSKTTIAGIDVGGTVSGNLGLRTPRYQIFYENFPEGGMLDMWTESYPWSGSSISGLVFTVAIMKVAMPAAVLGGKVAYKVISKTVRGLLKAPFWIFRQISKRMSKVKWTIFAQKMEEKATQYSTQKGIRTLVREKGFLKGISQWAKGGYYKRLNAMGKAYEYAGSKEYKRVMRDLLDATPDKPLFDKSGKLMTHWKNADNLRAVNTWLRTLSAEDEKVLRKELGIPTQKVGLFKQWVVNGGKKIYKTVDQKVAKKIANKVPRLAKYTGKIVRLPGRIYSGIKATKVAFRKKWREFVSKEKALEPAETKKLFDDIFATCRKTPKDCEEFYKSAFPGKKFTGEAIDILKAQDMLRKNMAKNDWIMIVPKGTKLHESLTAGEGIAKRMDNELDIVDSLTGNSVDYKNIKNKYSTWADVVANEGIYGDATTAARGIREEALKFGITDDAKIGSMYDAGKLYSDIDSVRPNIYISHGVEWSELPLNVRRTWMRENPGLTAFEAKEAYGVAYAGYRNPVFGFGKTGSAGGEQALRNYYIKNGLLKDEATKLIDPVTKKTISEAQILPDVLSGTINNRPVLTKLSATYLSKRYIGRAVMMDIGRFKWNFWYGGAATQEYENRLTENLDTGGNLVYVRAGKDVEVVPLDPAVKEAGGVKLWRPGAARIPAFIQTGLLATSVKENPRFYTVSPCFGWLKVWRGSDAVYVTAQKCEEYSDTSNYCYADNDLIWGTSGDSPVPETWAAFTTTFTGCTAICAIASARPVPPYPTPLDWITFKACVKQICPKWAGAVGVTQAIGSASYHAVMDKPNPDLLKQSTDEQQGTKKYLQENNTIGINEWFPPNSYGYWNYYAAADMCDVMSMFLIPGGKAAQGAKWAGKLKFAAKAYAKGGFVSDLCMEPYIVGEMTVAWPNLGQLKTQLDDKQITDKQVKCIWGID